MHGLLFLSMIFLQLHAADDGSLVVMYQRLEEAEKKSDFSGELKFAYTSPFEGSVVNEHSPKDWKERSYYGSPLRGIRGVMQEENALQEVDYFIQLAASKRLSDTEKLKKPLVCTNYFMQLESKEQKEKDEALKQLLWVANDPAYSVGRLLIAASAHAGANVNYKDFTLLKTSLVKDDVSLSEMALQRGADPNEKQYQNSILSDCKSLEAAQVMVEYGADVAKASWAARDLIVYHLGWSSNSWDDTNILRFYLQHIPLSKENEWGKQWMEAAAEGRGPYQDQIVDRIEILLKHGCEYNEEIKQKICKKVGEKSPELKKEIECVFANHEEPGKNIKGADE